VLQSVAVRCSVIQMCVAVCCSVLQCVAMCPCVAVCCSVLQSVVECCSVLQCVAVCCSVLQSVVECCRVLQRVAVCCSVLQSVAVCSRNPLSRCTQRSRALSVFLLCVLFRSLSSLSCVLSSTLALCLSFVPPPSLSRALSFARFLYFVLPLSFSFAFFSPSRACSLVLVPLFRVFPLDLSRSHFL